MKNLTEKAMSQGDDYVCRHFAGDEGIDRRIDKGTVYQDDFQKSYRYGYTMPEGYFPPFAEVCQ